MKKKELCAVACLFWLAGCNDPASDEVEIVKNLFPVQFSVQLQKEVLPFPSTRSMPSNAFPEPIVPDKENPDKELKDFCSTIEYLVYDKNDLEEPVKHHIYNVETDNDFSIVYDTSGLLFSSSIGEVFICEKYVFVRQAIRYFLWHKSLQCRKDRRNEYGYRPGADCKQDRV